MVIRVSVEAPSCAQVACTWASDAASKRRCSCSKYARTSIARAMRSVDSSSRYSVFTAREVNIVTATSDNNVTSR
jgi:hypothetical protein